MNITRVRLAAGIACLAAPAMAQDAPPAVFDFVE